VGYTLQLGDNGWEIDPDGGNNDWNATSANGTTTFGPLAQGSTLYPADFGNDDLLEIAA